MVGKRVAEDDSEDVAMEGDEMPTSTNRRQKITAKPWFDGDIAPDFAFPAAYQQYLRGPPPPVPASVPSHHPLTAPHFDKLGEKYDTHTISVSRNGSIRSKITHLLQVLRSASPASTAEQRQAVVALSARMDAANKLVSVVEIAKRELNGAWFQYTGAWQRMEQLKDKGKNEHKEQEKEREGEMLAKWGPGRRLKDGRRVTNHKMDDDMEDADQEEDVASDEEEQGPIASQGSEAAFQTVVEPERDKVRLIPVMTVYLSRGPVAELRQLFG